MSRHGYYASKKRDLKAASKREKRLLNQILKAYQTGRGAYGYRRVYAHLEKKGITNEFSFAGAIFC